MLKRSLTILAFALMLALANGGAYAQGTWKFIKAPFTADTTMLLTDGTVIVFSSDSQKWAEDSRFVRSGRPDQQGQYQIRGPPAGEYLAVAIDYVQEGMWNDPEFLESLRRYAQRVTISEGNGVSLALRLTAVENQ